MALLVVLAIEIHLSVLRGAANLSDPARSFDELVTDQDIDMYWCTTTIVAKCRAEHFRQNRVHPLLVFVTL